jgi:DNA processing protein
MNYAAAICFFPKINLKRARDLFAFFNDPKDAFEAELDELVGAGLSEEIAHEFIAWREIASVETITSDLKKFEIETVTIGKKGYPPLLSEITDPPPVLFYRGTLPDPERPSVSVVGTRKCTNYGKQMTEAISADLGEQGVVVVSGLALGVDGYAHGATLSKKGTTVAVLGSGVDRFHIHPSSHQALSERILEEGGAIVSEYPPGFSPTLYSFPARNRIIAGLSLGVVVTEAPTTSGALITAARALDYNRDVFAVPHPVGSVLGEGCNTLIRRGAALVTSADDIMDNLQLQHQLKTQKTANTAPEDPKEALIYNELLNGPKHIDALIKATKIPSRNLTGMLTLLEMRGKVRNNGGMTYSWL